MQFTITNRGVPLGTVDLTPAGLVVAELSPAPGYSSVRDTLRAASEFLWRLGVLAEGGAADSPLDSGSLSRAAALPLELRDASGAAVAADYVNILERPDPADAPIVIARFEHAAASVPAHRSIPPRDEGARNSRPDV